MTGFIPAQCTGYSVRTSLELMELLEDFLLACDLMLVTGSGPYLLSL